ncbi:ABC transporter permease [Granulicatella sp. zg-ZJ]|uniref:ABC transporter permease n=1 Tax=Granulicatella sp. zg-ZJ TaxID=2678504 RepID=UPI001F07AEB8|nr:ABC transporter permease [Granulicatella sp. zg-ZJ]
MDMIVSSISQGLLWSVMAIGVYITYRLLDIADLTAEGSFPLGAAICASVLVNGGHPLLATCLGMLGGMVAGAISGFIHTKMKIPALLTGIITLTGLYTINLKILGKANVALLKQETLVTQVQSLGLDKSFAVIVIGLIFVGFMSTFVTLFMKTEIGFGFLATGDNVPMSEANGINVSAMKILGYMLSNGLIALSGALLTQNNGFADLNMGVGTIVIGLASIIIAEVMIKNLSLGWRFASVILGSIVYRLIIVFVLEIPGMDTQMVKLVSAILLAVILYVPEVQKALKIKPRISKEKA